MYFHCLNGDHRYNNESKLFLFYCLLNMKYSFCSRDIKRSLQLFLKESARKTGTVGERNPSWIMGLPIVHFLEGSLDPFAELDFTNFHDKQNDWWIDREFEKEKDELKSRKWSR